MKHGHRIEDQDGKVIKKWSEHFEVMNDDGYRIPGHKKGARMFDGLRFPAEMTNAEIGMMTVLARHYMVGHSNMLGYRQGKQIVPYNPVEIGELVGSHERQAYRFVDKMISLRMLQKVQTNSGAQYYVNPAYFMANGQRLSLDLFLLFRDELRGLIPDWTIRYFLRQASEKAIMGADAVQEAKDIVELGS